MTLAAFVVLIYGLFTLIGGVIGYKKAGSKASLKAGLIFGVVLLSCAYGIAEGIRAAYLAALIVSALLGIRFIKTWRTKKRIGRAHV